MAEVIRKSGFAVVDGNEDRSHGKPKSIAIFSSTNGHAQPPIEIQVGRGKTKSADVATIRFSAKVTSSNAPSRKPRLLVG